MSELQPSLPRKSGGSLPGRNGQPPHIPTDDNRQKVRTFAKVINQKAIAILLGVSEDTIQRHYRKEFDEGRAEAVARLGKDLLTSALSGNRRDRIKYLETQGAKYGWSRKLEISGADGGPVQLIDLTPQLQGMTDDQISAAIPIIEGLLTGLSDDGVPSYDATGAGADEGGAGPQGAGQDGS